MSYETQQDAYIKLSVKVKGAGSFYHFMLGEFLPVLGIILENGLESSTIYLVNNRCQKRKYLEKAAIFRHFYTELPFSVTVVNDENGLSNVKEKVFEVVRLDKLSTKFKDSTCVARLQRTVEWLKDFSTRIFSEKSCVPPFVIFQERGGISKLNRSVDNLSGCFDRFVSLSHPGVPLERCALMEPGKIETTLFGQIWQHMKCRVLVGEHGAGLLHLLWMPRGAFVIEVGTKEKLEKDYFQKIGINVAGLTFIQVEVKNSNAKECVSHLVDEEKVLCELLRALESWHTR